jgi:hypothetical protein
MEDNINLFFDNVDGSLVENVILIKDFSNSIMNHFFMLCHHLGNFKVFCNQFLSELIELDILLPLFKGAVISEAAVAIGELPEICGELKPALKSIGGYFLIAT